MTCEDCPGVPQATCLTEETIAALVAAIMFAGGGSIKDVTPEIQNFDGNSEESLSGLAVGAIGRIVTFGENGGGEVYITIDGTLPSATNGFTVIAISTCFCDINNVALEDVRMLGSAGGSSYFIVYEVYD